jgi:hypothetical protein
MAHLRHAYAVEDVKTGVILSRHRNQKAAHLAREKWGPPTKVVFTRRSVGEARKPRPDLALAASAAGDTAALLAFHDQAGDLAARLFK